ncbi:hypothetical protein HOLleu_22154 [Holothuria leucospilota]|uniref:NACHT domain-containing protein n=1 Tax=Holothuria leucospilota TaxID=206669 RepID=A0A9Q1BYN7_HOLLE|nr:hypothetical protein HOLleu_22154 [Holothuria leucospilota]
MGSLNRIIGACLIVISGIYTHADIYCPNIYIARGGSRVINCLSNRKIKDFYWYRGTTSTSRPILGLQDGRKGGTEYGGEHFNIFENGSMSLENVKIEHESYYTFVGYYDLIHFDNATFLVTVTISPDPRCPVITGCRPCEVCTIDAPKKSDSVTCRVTGARPLIPLSWNITSQSGISFVQYDAIEQSNEDMDSWDTYISLDYELTEPCGVIAEVQCIAEDVAELTSSNKVTLGITNELCNGTTPTPDAAPAGFGSNLLVLTIVLLVVVIIICFLIGCYKYYRRQKKGRAKSMNVAPQRDGCATGETDVPLLTNKGKPRKVNKEVLVKALALFYEKFCSLKPLPWGEPIPISALYSDFQCLVTQLQSAEYTTEESQDLEKITSSEDLFASIGFKHASRVIFIADLGYGKTTMTQQVVQQWIKEDPKNFILIYIQLKEVDAYKSIAALVNDMLPSSMNANLDDIEKILEDSNVLVLLDGLDELSMSVAKDVCEGEKFDDGSRMVKSNNAKEMRHPECVSDHVTMVDLLKGNCRNLKSQIRVWVTSREVDDMETPFPPPYVKIKMTGFSKYQVNAYIRKTCQYYIHSVKESNAETTEATIAHVVKKVRDILDKDDIIREFVNTPLLLVLIIHILTAKFAGAVKDLIDLKLTKLTTLIRTIISCLESRYVQKVHDESIRLKIERLEKQLGEIAWRQKLEITNYDRKGWDKLLGTEYVNIGISIGLLRLSKQISNSNLQMRQLAFSSFTGIEFYHQYFLEYLAGQYFSTEETAMKDLEKFLEENTDDKTIRFLQFMFGSGHPAVKKVSQMFLKDQKMWNNFIDCIYETEDQEKVKSYLEKMSRTENWFGKGPVVNFKYLDRKYHQNAVTAFCESFNRFNIPIRAFMFSQDCPLKYLTTLNIPQLKRLELFEMHISDEDFVSILEWLSRQKLPKTFQFTKCKFEEKLSEDSKQNIKTSMEGKTLNIYRNKTKSQMGIFVDYFNVEKGEWTRKLLPKNQ